MASEEEVKILAANLFNKKIAASMYDAMEKAKNILNVQPKKAAFEEEEFWRESREIKEEQMKKAAEAKEEPISEKLNEELKDLENMNASQPEQQKDDMNAWEVGMNNENMTLNELVKETDAKDTQPEDPKIQQIIEETGAIKEEIKEAEKNPEIIGQVFIITHDKEMEYAASGKLYVLEREKESDGVTKIAGE